MKDLQIDGRQPTVWSRAYFVVYSCLMLLGWLVFFSTSPWSGPSALIFLALYVLSIRMWMSALLFASGMILFYFLEYRSVSTIDPMLLMFGGLTLLTVAFESALKTCREFQQTTLADDLMKWIRPEKTELNNSNQASLEVTQPQRTANNDWLFDYVQQVLRIVLSLVVAAVAAGTVLNLFPVIGTFSGGSTRNTYGLSNSGYRLIAVSLSVFFVMAILWLISNEIRRRTFSVSQSRVFLRNVLASHLHPDLRRIFRRMNVVRRKRVVKTVSAEMPTSTQSENVDKSQDRIP